MSRPVPAGVDLRGFGWPLAALERKLEHDLERQGVRLAEARREVLALQTALTALEASHRNGARAADAATSGPIDPAARRQTLAYLLRELGSVSRHRRECDRSRKVAEAEAELLLRADRALSAVRRLRDSALAAHASQQVRRQCREADFAWLVRRVPSGRGDT
jgi:hypothetical protein